MHSEAVYELKKYRSWKMEIHFFVLNFFNQFHVYPEHACASKITFDRIELLSGKNFEAVQRSYFGSYKYNLHFSICNNLADHQVCLLVSQPKYQTGRAPLVSKNTPKEQLALKFEVGT